MEKTEEHRSVSHTERCHRSLLGHTVLTKDSECAALKKALFDYYMFPHSLHQGWRAHRLRGQGPKAASRVKQNYKPKSEIKALRGTTEPMPTKTRLNQKLQVRTVRNASLTTRSWIRHHTQTHLFFKRIRLLIDPIWANSNITEILLQKSVFKKRTATTQQNKSQNFETEKYLWR